MWCLGVAPLAPTRKTVHYARSLCTYGLVVLYTCLVALYPCTKKPILCYVIISPVKKNYIKLLVVRLIVSPWPGYKLLYTDSLNSSPMVFKLSFSLWLYVLVIKGVRLVFFVEWLDDYVILSCNLLVVRRKADRSCIQENYLRWQSEENHVKWYVLRALVVINIQFFFHVSQSLIETPGKRLYMRLFKSLQTI